MPESLMRSEDAVTRMEDLELCAISREEFLLRQDEALDKLMDGLEMDYRDDITATYLVNYKGTDTYVA